MPSRKMCRYDENFARNFAIERARQGYTYESLASKLTQHGLPIDQSSLYRIERSGRPTSIGEAVILSDVLGVDLSAMIR